jgi:hypothetical protein
MSRKKSIYRSLLRTEEWAERRSQILQRDNHQCRECGNTENLNVHHRYYVSGRAPWDYPDWSLVTLCRICHEAQHKKPVWDDWEWMMQDFQPDAPEAQELADTIAQRGYGSVNILQRVSTLQST